MNDDIEFVVSISRKEVIDNILDGFKVSEKLELIYLLLDDLPQKEFDELYQVIIEQKGQ